MSRSWDLDLSCFALGHTGPTCGTYNENTTMNFLDAPEPQLSTHHLYNVCLKSIQADCAVHPVNLDFEGTF